MRTDLVQQPNQQYQPLVLKVLFHLTSPRTGLSWPWRLWVARKSHHGVPGHYLWYWISLDLTGEDIPHLPRKAVWYFFFLSNQNYPRVTGNRNQGLLKTRGWIPVKPRILSTLLFLTVECAVIVTQSHHLKIELGKARESCAFTGFGSFMKQVASSISECHTAWLGHRISHSA